MTSSVSGLHDGPAPRTGKAARHDPRAVPAIAGAAVILCCGSCADPAALARDRERGLLEFPRLENGLPGRDRVLRLFRPLDPVALSATLGLDRRVGRPHPGHGVQVRRIKARNPVGGGRDGRHPGT
ncbi:MAG: transposase family protein [Rhodobacter sp.]|nr:transposase family protein [Rhodobacter sp.]